MRDREYLLFAQFEQFLLILKTPYLLLASLNFPLKLVDGSARLPQGLSSRLNALLESRLVPLLVQTQPLKQERDERRGTCADNCQKLKWHRRSSC